jgi:hypothetical protein
VPEGERRDLGDIGLADVPSLAGELVERGLDIGRVPECDGVLGFPPRSGGFAKEPRTLGGDGRQTYPAAVHAGV